MEVIRNIITNTNNFEKGRSQWSGNPFVVLHTYGGNGTNLYNWFQTNTVQVSSHFSIEKDGTIRQYVELDDTAYANGTSWSNSNGVSVEFQDDNDYNNPNTYTQKQIDAFAWLFVNVINPWASGRIANNEAGITPHNKWVAKECPGKLWDRRQELYSTIDKLNEKPVEPTTPPVTDDCKEIKQQNKQLKKEIEYLDDALKESEIKLKATQELLELSKSTIEDKENEIATLELQIKRYKASIWYAIFKLLNK